MPIFTDNLDGEHDAPRPTPPMPQREPDADPTVLPYTRPTRHRTGLQAAIADVVRLDGTELVRFEESEEASGFRMLMGYASYPPRAMIALASVLISRLVSMGLVLTTAQLDDALFLIDQELNRTRPA